MIAAQPSRTALAAAMYRAAHQELDEGQLFADPFAMRILGDAALRQRALEFGRARPLMRAFIAMRSRVAEERLGAAVRHGMTQIVVLGAGLDTLGVRNPYPDAMIYEVDHPATQAWKRQQLEAAGLTVGDSVRFVPVDFEHEVLAEELERGGFDSDAPTFFVWLGVVPYLTDDAVFGTLGTIAGIAGSETVFDYGNPTTQLEPEFRAHAEARAKRAAAIGEPFLSSFDTDDLHRRLRLIGATEIDDLGPQRLAALYGRASPVGDRGGHIVWVRF